MRKKITTLITLMIITMLGIIIILNNINKPYEIKDTNDGQFAFFYEDENGDYQRSTDSKWDSGNYILNLENTTCDGVNNPNFLSWNNDNNSVTLTRNKATKCSLYFDIKTFDMDCDEDLLSCFIAKKQGTQVGDKEGEELLYHNNTIDVNNDGSPDDAGDLSYRYSGDDPDNFVCFGTYDSPCPEENLYRIIGVFPFTKEDGTIEYRVKLIKSEYLTAEELKDSSNGSGSFNGNYVDLVRVNKAPKDTFYWDDNGGAVWKDSSLNKKLNSGYLNETIPEKWRNKISFVDWNTGSIGSYSLSPKSIYDKEIALEKVNTKIGLMYVSDYGFTSSKVNWSKKMFCSSATDENCYNGDTNRKNNWLFNATFDWTIINSGTNVIDANWFGDCHSHNSKTFAMPIRPTFYLNSNVRYKDGDGSRNNPYRIELDVFDYDYKPEAQEFTAPVEGDYKIELWGASGRDYEGYYGGKGAYTSGIIHLKENDKLYIYTGEQGFYGDMDRTPFNGGGKVIWSLYGGTGGGATDIRLEKTSWNNFNGLKARIMVAAGGGGANNRNGDNPEIYYGRGNGGAGGALTGLNGEYDLVSSTNPNDGVIWGYFYGSGGNQVKAGTGIIGENNSDAIANDFSLYKPEGHFGYADSSQSGGGGGYYAGGGGEHAGAGGGSSFISGYQGCVAIKDTSSEENIISKCTEENAKDNIECSYHYSGKIFTKTVMKAGNESIPSPNGGTEIGHSGNGYARISFINE